MNCQWRLILKDDMGEVYGIVWREKESWWKNEDIEKVVKDKKVAQKRLEKSQLQEDIKFL